VASKTALVLAVLYGVLWAVRRFAGRSHLAHRGPVIQLVHTTHLGPGRSVHVLGVSDRLILIGATSHQVSLLAELDPMETGPADSGNADGGFERQLRQAVERLPFLSVAGRAGTTPRGDDEPGAGR
jgi:flagellar biosynthetic protein FliO